MLSKFSILINLVLIVLIIIQMPKENIGLTSLGNNNNFLSSLTKAEKLIKILTIIGIFGHVFFAYKLDINI